MVSLCVAVVLLGVELRGVGGTWWVDVVVGRRHGGVTRTSVGGEYGELDGVATANGDTMLVFAEGQAVAFTLPGMGGGAGEGTASDGALISPMPGRVIAVDARQGDKVAKGQKIGRAHV